LREAGIDAAHVADLGMSSAADVDILAWCREHGVVAVTLDADFHASIALSGATSPSAIRLRMQGLKGPEVARLLLDVLSAREAQLAAGALITVQHGRLRLRSLPVARRPE
jgi:predicted nuclease of predicted toxin-antitoxin system